MTGMQMLTDCRGRAYDIAQLEEQLERLRAAVKATDGAMTEQLKHLKSEVRRCERELKDVRRRQSVERNAVTLLSNALRSVDGQVLYSYYADSLSIAQVATALHYSDVYVRKIKRRAEQAVAGMSAEELRRLCMLPDWYMA